MYKICQLQNSSNYPKNLAPTIIITEKDDNWQQALSNYLSGKTPTDNLEWKKGVFAITKEIK
jgi:hypothetical protein